MVLYFGNYLRQQIKNLRSILIHNLYAWPFSNYKACSGVLSAMLLRPKFFGQGRAKKGAIILKFSSKIWITASNVILSIGCGSRFE